ncbi:lipopolysaccharide biosynthesis protein [Kocuria sabuli]|uniref:lipopolysaccharide biosynthesis protein n=1 Tax=Kocuria sabuli TaxID=3071448 RepID=UPI0034D56E3E
MAAVAQTCSLVLLARWSSTGDFGLVIAVQSVVTAMTWMLGLGLGPYMSVVRARNREHGDVQGIYRLNKIISSVLVALLSVIVLMTMLWDGRAWWFLPLVLALGFQRDAAVLNSIAVADGQTGLFSSNLALRRVLALVSFVVGVMSSLPVAFAFSMSIAASEAACNWRLRRMIDFVPLRSQPMDVRRIVQDSKHYWWDTVSGQIRLLDVPVVGIALGPIASGLLAVPSKIGSPIMMIPTSLATLVLPRTSAAGTLPKGKFMLAAGLVTAFIAVILLALAVFIEPIIVSMLGEEFRSAVPVTLIYFVGYLSLSMIYMMNAAMQGLRLHALVSRISMAGSLLSLGGLWAGSAYGGLEMGAAGYVGGIIFQLTILTAFWVRKPSQ